MKREICAEFKTLFVTFYKIILRSFMSKIFSFVTPFIMNHKIFFTYACILQCKSDKTFMFLK